jgi:protein associated with RNAse G/E
VEENKRTREGDEIVVRVLNDEGHERRRWSARIAKHDGPLVVLDAVFEEEIQHDLLGRIASGNVSKEYYWLDRWYNVFRFNERFYCNVTKPPSFDGSILTYVDLDIDVLVESDFSYRVLDLEDFEARSYPAEVQQNARNALDEVINLVESKAYPFDE